VVVEGLRWAGLEYFDWTSSVARRWGRVAVRRASPGHARSLARGCCLAVAGYYFARCGPQLRCDGSQESEPLEL
jgi:hypothetical protein